jgi:hypothetical protein
VRDGVGVDGWPVSGADHRGQEYKSNITAIVTQAQAASVKVIVSTITPSYEDDPTKGA